MEGLKADASLLKAKIEQIYTRPQDYLVAKYRVTSSAQTRFGFLGLRFCHIAGQFNPAISRGSSRTSPAWSQLNTIEMSVTMLH